MYTAHSLTAVQKAGDTYKKCKEGRELTQGNIAPKEITEYTKMTDKHHTTNAHIHRTHMAYTYTYVPYIIMVHEVQASGFSI